MTANPVLWDLDARGVATVTLNRPEVNNAYDAGLINGVLAAMDELGKKPNLRVVVLKGNGKHFQAGADLKWINGVRPKSAEENEAVSRATFDGTQDRLKRRESRLRARCSLKPRKSLQRGLQWSRKVRLQKWCQSLQNTLIGYLT